MIQHCDIVTVMHCIAIVQSIISVTLHDFYMVYTVFILTSGSTYLVYIIIAVGASLVMKSINLCSTVVLFNIPLCVINTLSFMSN